MAKAEKTYTDPITVRFPRPTFERLSRIRLAVQQMTGAKIPMSALIVAAVVEYVERHDDAAPKGKKR